MQTAIIVHGMPSKEEYLDGTVPSPSNSHWLPWLQRQLLLRGIVAQTPEMPEPYEPKYELWKSVFEQFTLNEETVLVGHSCGGGFLVRYLSENEIKVGAVVLVAPWIDTERSLATKMFDFSIDTHLAQKTRKLTVFVSSEKQVFLRV